MLPGLPAILAGQPLAVPGACASAVACEVCDGSWRRRDSAPVFACLQEYILKRMQHPMATGGSPIVTWLSNQLQAVLQEMETVYGAVPVAKKAGWAAMLRSQGAWRVRQRQRAEVLSAVESAKNEAEMGFD